jgi:hypothetical protein
MNERQPRPSPEQSPDIYLKPNTRVEVRKIDVKSGEKTEVQPRSEYTGSLLRSIRTHDELELVDSSGDTLFNSTSVVAVRKQNDRLIIETRTSFYEVRVVKEAGDSIFEGIERSYGLADIQAFQKACRDFDNLRQREHADYVLGSGQLYQYLLSGSFSERLLHPAAGQMIRESDAPDKDYASLIVAAYLDWRKNVLANWDAAAQRNPRLQGGKTAIEKEIPRSLPELRDLYRRHPALSDVCGVSYQDGLAEEGTYENPFLHFHGHRMSGYAYEKSETAFRIYTNPPRASLPAFARDFIQRAEDQKVPFYFKMLDFSLQQPTAGDASRMDRLVFYIGKDHADDTRKIFEDMQENHPEWFKDRPLPPLVAPLNEGVGVAQDPSPYQDAHFSRPGEKTTSFNWVRAQFLKDVWIGLAQEIVRAYPNTALQNGNTAHSLFEKEYGHAHIPGNEQRSLNDALLRFIVTVLPQLSPNILLPLISKHIEVQAIRYHIDPQNLAANKGD